MNFYLQERDNHTYSIQLLGTNGEGIPNAHLVLTYGFDRGCFNQLSKPTITVQLKTNKNGEIIVKSEGKLTTLAVSANGLEGGSISKSWVLWKPRERLQYSSEMNVSVGEKITVPWQDSWTIYEALLIKTTAGSLKEDITHQLTIDKYRLVLPASNEEATYILSILPIDQNITINIKLQKKIY